MLVSYILPFEALCDCGLAFIGHRWVWTLRATSPQTRMNTVFPLACITFPKGHLFNEQYARDISRKINAAFAVKMREGQFISAFAVYGYQKDPGNKNHLIVDEKVAPVVRRMFRMAYEGFPPKQIAQALNDDGIMTPAQYRCLQFPGLRIEDYSKRQEWTSSTVSKMLRNKTYTGCTVHRKTKKASFKSKAVISIPREKWIIHEDMHEAIVSKEIFDGVAKCTSSRKSNKTTGFENLFQGIAFCADCGRAMSATETRKKGHLYNLSCGRYKLYGSSDCTNHFIDYMDLCDIVYRLLMRNIAMVTGKQWDALYKRLLSNQKIGSASQKASRSARNELATKQKGIDEIIQQLYEDRVKGLIGEQRFLKLLAIYEEQQAHVHAQLAEMGRPKPEPDEGLLGSYESFKRLVEETAIPDHLTRQMCLSFVDRIEVHQGTWKVDEQGEKYKEQKVEVKLRFLGNVTA